MGKRSALISLINNRSFSRAMLIATTQAFFLQKRKIASSLTLVMTYLYPISARRSSYKRQCA